MFFCSRHQKLSIEFFSYWLNIFILIKHKNIIKNNTLAQLGSLFPSTIILYCMISANNFKMQSLDLFRIIARCFRIRWMIFTHTMLFISNNLSEVLILDNKSLTTYEEFWNDCKQSSFPLFLFETSHYLMDGLKDNDQRHQGSGWHLFSF